MATAITLVRILLVPLVIILLYQPHGQVWAAGIFALIAATDWLDGYIARRFDQVSDMGKFLDPLADKILVMSVLVVLAVQLKVDVFSVLILNIREFVIMGVRLVAANKGIVIAASQSAKWKTALQMVAIFLVLMKWPYGLALYYVSVLLAVISLGEYLWQQRECLKG
jgi:CDP-diacylglycerol--glycerol-3-phosphate 3-phosphatidyltransferase